MVLIMLLFGSTQRYFVLKNAVKLIIHHSSKLLCYTSHIQFIRTLYCDIIVAECFLCCAFHDIITQQLISTTCLEQNRNFKISRLSSKNVIIECNRRQHKKDPSFYIQGIIREYGQKSDHGIITHINSPKNLSN